MEEKEREHVVCKMAGIFLNLNVWRLHDVLPPVAPFTNMI